jgi:SAM-dependent methyltransferase
MSSYDALAASYDALTVDVEYRRRADYLTRQFHRSAFPVETVLDLACGTGTMACLLAERGYRMIAVDGSEEMLTQAAWKAAALEQPPMFLHQSMPRLHLGMEVDAAISTLDALNYLTRTADLRETLPLAAARRTVPIRCEHPLQAPADGRAGLSGRDRGQLLRLADLLRPRPEDLHLSGGPVPAERQRELGPGL